MSKAPEVVAVEDIATGDQVRFVPDSRERAWWKVVGRDAEHIVAIRQAPFHPKGIVEYTVTGHMDGQRNGAGPGAVRSSLNTLGGGWDLSDREGGAGAAEILDALKSGRFELSMRRVVSIISIQRRASA